MESFLVIWRSSQILSLDSAAIFLEGVLFSGMLKDVTEQGALFNRIIESDMGMR